MEFRERYCPGDDAEPVCMVSGTVSESDRVVGVVADPQVVCEELVVEGEALDHLGG